MFIPACCTRKLQPLNVACNRIFKDELRIAFVEWYTSEGLKGGETAIVNFLFAFVKEVHGEWLVRAFYSCQRPALVFFSDLEKSKMYEVDCSASE